MKAKIKMKPAPKPTEFNQWSPENLHKHIVVATYETKSIDDESDVYNIAQVFDDQFEADQAVQEKMDEAPIRGETLVSLIAYKVIDASGDYMNPRT